jgi:hypothetical protein
VKSLEDLRNEFAATITAKLPATTLHEIAEQGSELLKRRDGEEWKLLLAIYDQAMKRITAA